jgi:hypothetical protein
MDSHARPATPANLVPMIQAALLAILFGGVAMLFR